MRKEEGGAAATLAILTIFVIMCSVLALHTFEEGYQRQFLMVQRRMAVDTTRAVAAVVEDELNHALRVAVEVGMYEAGRRGEDKEGVEERVLGYLDQRIAAGWSYSCLRDAHIENIYEAKADNSFLLAWLPDGSLRASGCLDAIFEHVTGAKAYGIRLDAGVVPRYGRLRHLAYHVYSSYIQGKQLDENGLALLEDELNENYACEHIRFDLRMEENRVRLSAYDTYAVRVIAENGS